MKNDSMHRKPRKYGFIELFPEYHLIICEGEKTEKYYFEGIKEQIRSKIQNNRIEVNIRVEGTGKNTLSLIDYAQRYVNRSLNIIGYVWLVYDKDDFPNDDFDNTHFKAESISNENVCYKSAWSNQCIELWFLLHFIDNKSDLHRNVYSKKLDDFFNGKYEKNRKDIFEFLKNNGDMNKAINRAKILYSELKGKTPSKMTPATKLYELIEFLDDYM